MNSHKRDEYKREIAEQKQEIAELKMRIYDLLGAMNLLRDDLLSRGEIDHDGTRVVNCGASAWRVFCDAIDETPAQSLQQIKRDAVLEAIDPVQSKFLKYVKAVEFAETQQKFVLMGAEAFRGILKSHANRLVKDGDNEK